MIKNYTLKQLAFNVQDVREAALQHSRSFGSGPFFVIDYPPTPVIYRGEPIMYQHSIALGQWGSVHVELVQDHNVGPSIMKELYPKAGGTGMHHVALFVDDLEAAVASYREAGHAEAQRVSLPDMGIEAVFVDTVKAFGYFTELFEPLPLFTGMFDALEKASIGFDGTDPVREGPPTDM